MNPIRLSRTLPALSLVFSRARIVNSLRKDRSLFFEFACSRRSLRCAAINGQWECATQTSNSHRFSHQLLKIMEFESPSSKPPLGKNPKGGLTWNQ